MGEIKRILIAIDDEKSGKKVATSILQLVKQLNAEVAIVSVVDTVVLMTDGGVTPQELTEFIEKDYEKCQQFIINKVFKDQKVETFIKNGKPFDEIIKVAKRWKADLIVIGTHGRKGFSRLALGSVAENVIRNSTKPVFVVPL